MENLKVTLGAEVYSKIRRLYNQGLSRRKIAKTCYVSRYTVDKYCQGAQLLTDRKGYPNVISEFQKMIEDEMILLLEEHKEKAGKQQIQSKHIWEMLRSKGFNVGESTIRRYIHDLKQKQPAVFIPLSFEPGEALEIDWGDMYAYIDSIKTTVSTFCSVLPHSYGIYAVPTPTKAYESFFWSHIKAFEYFGGIPIKCIYDNLKTAVFSGTGKNAITQDTFKYFEGHYSFESVFCSGAAGWEKGGVENLVKTIRRIAFTPIPKVKSFEELILHVHEKCVKYNNEHKLRGRSLSISEALKTERENLLPLPLKPFDFAKTVLATVYKSATFIFETNTYSIFPDYIGKTVTLRVTPLEIHVHYGGKSLYTHKRTYKQNDPQYIPEHYLKYIERKPRSIENALPLKIGVLPDELNTFRSLCKEKEKCRELMNVLKLGEFVDLEKLLWAVDMANKCGTPTYQLVTFYLSIQNEEIKEGDYRILDSHLDMDDVDLSVYDDLLPGNNEDKERN